MFRFERAKRYRFGEVCASNVRRALSSEEGGRSRPVVFRTVITCLSSIIHHRRHRHRHRLGVHNTQPLAFPSSFSPERIPSARPARQPASQPLSGIPGAHKPRGRRRPAREEERRNRRTRRNDDGDDDDDRFLLEPRPVREQREERDRPRAPGMLPLLRPLARSGPPRRRPLVPPRRRLARGFLRRRTPVDAPGPLRPMLRPRLLGRGGLRRRRPERSDRRGPSRGVDLQRPLRPDLAPLPQQTPRAREGRRKVLGAFSDVVADPGGARHGAGGRGHGLAGVESRGVRLDVLYSPPVLLRQLRDHPVESQLDQRRRREDGARHAGEDGR
ncbi:hypothetical protein ACHAWF_001542, partial [Thalassiosira exigua]